MKIAFASSSTGGLNDKVSDKFGRCPTFTIVTVENGKIISVTMVENPGHKAVSGAGIKAVQKLVNEGVDAIVAGNFGPNAEVALHEVGIKTYVVRNLTIREALDKILSEKNS